MLSDSVVQELEAALYATLRPGASQIKVARLIATTFPDDWPGDERLQAAVEALVQRDDIECFGLIHRWRHSEIRRLRRG